MKLYYVDNEYVEYLRKTDKRIYDNKLSDRPYIGIVLSVNGFKYYAPLSSPKPKHLKMKNSKDFRKINGRVYGVINFNYMIPVNDSIISQLNIKSLEDEKYKKLVQNQIRYLKNDWGNILETAKDLYKTCAKDGNQLNSIEIKIKRRCCDFKLLELRCKEYNNMTD